MDYPAFVAFVCQAADEAPNARPLRIPDLRRSAGAGLARDVFDRYLLSLRDDGHAHLLTHVDADILPDADRRDSLLEADGLLLYWVRWVRREGEPPS